MADGKTVSIKGVKRADGTYVFNIPVGVIRTATIIYHIPASMTEEERDALRESVIESIRISGLHASGPILLRELEDAAKPAEAKEVKPHPD